MAEQSWNTDFLEQMRHRGDLWADGIVQELLNTGGDEALEQFLKQLAKVHDGVPDDLPPDIRDYFLKEDVPNWVDLQQVTLGENFYTRNGIEIGVILLCASLPVCYAASRGVRVLDLSRQLTQHPERRIIETMRFVLDVMSPGGLSSEGHGRITAKKIRVLHATMRHVMRFHPQTHLKTPVTWNEADWGTPLNQTDLALTLMTFSTVVLDSLKKLNITVHPDEEAAYFHAWRYVGHLMGVDESLNPATADEGRAMLTAIQKVEYGKSEAGSHVTRDLVNFLEQIVPGTLMDGIIPSKIRFLIGDEIADMLDVPRADWTRVLIPMIQAIHGVEHAISDDSRAFSLVTDFLGRQILSGLEGYLRSDGRPMFHVPFALREHWKLPPPPPKDQAVVADTATPTTPVEAALDAAAQ